MATLYIDRQGCELRLDGRAVAVYEQGNLLARVPGRMADRVVLSCEMSISTGALTALAEMGVAVVVVRRGKAAVLVGGPRGDAGRRMKQYAMALDEERRRRWSGRLVAAKLRGQMRVLRLLAERRVEMRARVLGALEVMSRGEQRCHEGGLSVESLRGVEGAGGAAYFSAYREGFAPSLKFTGRNRRPPRDPVNAALSLGYTMLYAAAVREIHGAGLDPHVGFYHEVAPGRASLACDLAEPLRARVDQMVWGLFRERGLRGDHFQKQGAACLLGKAGRQVFYAAWREQEESTGRRLRQMTGMVMRAFGVEEGSEAGEQEDGETEI